MNNTNPLYLIEATLSDYFKHTLGTFRFKFSGNNFISMCLKANLEGYRPIHFSTRHNPFICRGEVIHCPPERTLKNRIYYLKYIDPSSAYFIDPSGKKLLRISDHWSESNINNVFTCGNIRSCYWRLQGKQGSSAKGEIQAGIIDLEKLQDPYTIINPNHAKHTTNNYFGDVLEPTKRQKLIKNKKHL